METERQDGWYWARWWFGDRADQMGFCTKGGSWYNPAHERHADPVWIGERILENETLRQMREKADALDWLEDSGEGLVSDFAASVGERMIWKVEARSNWHKSPLAAIRAAREEQGK